MPRFSTDAYLVTGVRVPSMHATIRRTRYDVLGVGREAALNGDAPVVHVAGEGLQEISNGNVRTVISMNFT